MAFQLTQEQLALQETFRRFLADKQGDKVSSAYLRKRLAANNSSDQHLWRAILELGLFELLNDVGSAGNLQYLALIAHETGRYLLAEPLVESLVSGPYLMLQLLEGKERELLASWLGADYQKILTGSSRICIAPLSSRSLGSFELSDNGKISGTQDFIFAADDSAYLLLANVKDCCISRIGKENISATTSLDQSKKLFCAKLSDNQCIRLSQNVSEKLKSAMLILRARELAGITSRVIELTKEFVQTRRQFSVPVGGFQAVQHKLADMYAQSSALDALSRFAAWSASASPDQLELSARASIAYACDVGATIVEGAIQLHGGMGFTWESDLHLYLRRVKTIEALYSPEMVDEERLIAVL